MKSVKRLGALKLLLIILIIGLGFSAYVYAADPGHGAAAIGSGTFESGNYSFPDALGIGTATPVNRLDINGSINATNQINATRIYEAGSRVCSSTNGICVTAANNASGWNTSQVAGTIFTANNTYKVGIANQTPQGIFQVGNTLLVNLSGTNSVGSVGIFGPNAHLNQHINGTGVLHIRSGVTDVSDRIGPRVILDHNGNTYGDAGSIDFYAGSGGVNLVRGRLRFRLDSSSPDGGTLSYLSGTGEPLLTEKFTITTAGNVGINSPVPAAKLSVAGNVVVNQSGSINVTTGYVNVSGDVNATRIYEAGSRVCSQTNGICITSTSGNVSSWNRTGTTVLLNHPRDNVIINATSANTPLEVAGTLRTSFSTNQNLYGQIRYDSSLGPVFESSGAAIHLSPKIGSPTLTATTAKVGINDTTPTATLHIISGEPSGSFIVQSPSAFHFFVNGSTGNVGVGTLAPNAKFAVSGNLTTTGAAYVGTELNVTSKIYEAGSRVCSSTNGICVTAANNASGWNTSQVAGTIFTANNTYKVGIGTATPGFALDVNGTVNITRDLYLNGTITNIPVTEVDSNRLVLYMPFDGNQNDYSGNSNHGTCTTCPIFNVSGKIRGGAYSYTPQSSTTVANSDILNLTQQWTISAWIRRASTGTQHSILEKYGSGVQGANYVIRVTSGDKFIAFNMETGVVHENCGTTSTTIAKDIWYHVAATFNNADDTLTCYINGVAEATNTTATINSPGSTTDIRIGCRGDDCATKFNGTIDEPIIWNRTLSEAEIKQIYNAGVYLLEQESYVRKAGDTLYGDLNIINGSENAVFNVNTSNSRVGIGTAIPDSKLNINGSGNLLNVTSGTTSILYVNGTNVGIGTGSPNSRVKIVADSNMPASALEVTGSTSFLLNVSNNTSPGLYVVGSGATSGVGIGTAGPSQELDVRGAENRIGVGAGGGQIALGHTAGAQVILSGENTDGSGGSFLVETKDTGGTYLKRILIREDGSVNAYGNLILNNSGSINVTNGYVNVSGDVNATRIYEAGSRVCSSTNGICVTAANNASGWNTSQVAGTIFTANNTYKVGIGTITPGSNLTVAGNVSVSTELYVGTELNVTSKIYEAGSRVCTADNGFCVVSAGGNASGWNTSHVNGSLFTANNTLRVGIGTNSPTARLNIQGSTSGSTTHSLNITRANGGNSLFVNDNGYVGIGRVISGQTAYPNALEIADSNAAQNNVTLLVLRNNFNAFAQRGVIRFQNAAANTSWITSELHSASGGGLLSLWTNKESSGGEPTRRLSIDGNGYLIFGGGENLGTSAQFEINSTSTSVIPFLVRGIASQAKNLTEWQNATSITVASVNQKGEADFANITLTSSVGTLKNATGSKKIEFSGGDVIITLG